MRACPYTHCPFLSKEDISGFECSDRIIIPRHVYVEHNLEETPRPLILCISNSMNDMVIGALHNLHEANNETIYMPTWMYVRLRTTSHLALSVAIKRNCNVITVRPHNRDFLDIDDWNTKFCAAIKYYNTLTVGVTIPIPIGNDIVPITVEKLNKGNADIVYLENGELIDLEILTPLECTVIPCMSLPPPIPSPTNNYISPRFIHDIPTPTTSGTPSVARPAAPRPAAPRPPVKQTSDSRFLYSAPPGTQIYPDAFKGGGIVLGGARYDKTRKPRTLAYKAVQARLRAAAATAPAAANALVPDKIDISGVRLDM
jgi:hypothetical protein